MIILIKALVVRDGKLLLLRRKKEEGGFWQPVGGKVEDESLNDALLRELYEETGIRDVVSVKELRSCIIDKHYITGKPTEPQKEYVFVVEVKTDKVKVDNIEHDSYGWFSFSEALKKVKWKNDVESISLLA